MPSERINSARYHVPVPGFTQAIKVVSPAAMIFVSGLTARTADGSILHEDDIRGQTRQILASLRAILEEAGASLADVVRTTQYLRDMDHHAVMQEVKHEFFAGHLPPSTSIEVSRLYDPRQLIEIDAIAVLTRP